MPRTIQVTKHLNDEEAEFRLATLMDEGDFDTVLSEDVDVISADTGRVIAKMRKAVISPITANQAAAAFKPVANAAGLNNRGNAVMKGSQGHRLLKNPDGTYSSVVSNTAQVFPGITRMMQSQGTGGGIVGYFDRSARWPFCRQTAFTAKHAERFEAGLPMVRAVSELYADLCPQEYELQRKAVASTSPDFVIKDTVYTTVTVNRNWRSAAHRDAGDFAEGMGNLTVASRHGYRGGYFGFPQYRVCFDMHVGDVLMADVHQIHGNTPIIPTQGDHERVSFVMYYREKMKECGAAAGELQRAKNRKRGSSING